MSFYELKRRMDLCMGEVRGAPLLNCVFTVDYLTNCGGPENVNESTVKIF